ncbi:GrpB family protein [Micromonospora sp. DT31]|uniref:GrpB family protein n=1 Tax=Micromonospora sp. DT31 TaxID=3393434 RepID=UPI003CF6AB7D
MNNDARIVGVVAHDPAWPEQFTVEQRLLAAALPRRGASNTSSASIPGLTAKPVIETWRSVGAGGEHRPEPGP